MITAWLTAKGLLGLKNQWWVIILAGIAALAFTVITIADNAVEDTLNTAKDAGKAQAESEGKSTTLKQNKDANDAGNQVRDNRGGAMYDECLRSSSNDTRANCEQFRN